MVSVTQASLVSVTTIEPASSAGAADTAERWARCVPANLRAVQQPGAVAPLQLPSPGPGCVFELQVPCCFERSPTFLIDYNCEEGLSGFVTIINL